MSRPTARHHRTEVLWEDSTVWHRGWEQIDDVLAERDAVQCTSVGFVLADDERGIVLAASVHGNEVAGVTMITRGQVVSTRRLR